MFNDALIPSVKFIDIYIEDVGTKLVFGSTFCHFYVPEQTCEMKIKNEIVEGKNNRISHTH